MLHRRIDSLLSKFLFVILLPLIAISTVFSRLTSAQSHAGRWKKLAQEDFADEFEFEQAIPAYEKLIDTTVEKQQQ